MRLALSAASLLSLALAAPSAWARVIYVDNHAGDDVNDGRSAETVGIQSGPVRSLERARVLVRPGDMIEIANTGEPYYGALRLIGSRCSGVPAVPVVVNGHGAVIDGSEPVDPEGWVSLGDDLWRLEPRQKGWYGLVRGSDAVPEVPAPRDAARPDPPASRWAAWRGAIYYRGEPDEIPANVPYRLSTREAGVFLYAVRYVVLRDLIVRHCRLDGVNAHGQVSDVLLENVVSESNGRSGFFVGGASRVVVQGGASRGNREASILLRELGKVEVRDTVLQADPVVAE